MHKIFKNRINKKFNNNKYNINNNKKYNNNINNRCNNHKIKMKNYKFYYKFQKIIENKQKPN